METHELIQSLVINKIKIDKLVLASEMKCSRRANKGILARLI